MDRLLLAMVLVVATLGVVRAQTPDSLRRDSIPAITDTVASAAADTTAKETRRERRQREKREQEAKEELKTVFKDSARLALEAMSVRPWKQSLMVPGWGQITNGGLWWIKVPVIYGGLVSAVLIFEFNNRYYHDILEDLQYRINNNNAIPPNPNFPNQRADQQYTDFMTTYKDIYRRNRDLTVLGTVGFWGLQAVEAYVTSMLKHRWEIGDDLTFKVSPTVFGQPSGVLAYQPPIVGLKVNFRF